MDREYQVSILIIDDRSEDGFAEKLFITQIFNEVDSSELNIKIAPNLKQAFSLLSSERFHIVLLDNDLGADSKGETIWGVDNIKRMKSISPNSKVFMNTSFDDIETIVQALRNGADNFFTKKKDDVSLKYKKEILLKALNDAKFEISILLGSIQSKTKFGEYISASKGGKESYAKMVSYSKSNEPILLLGPTGSGKSHAGEMIHKISKKTRNEPNRSYTYIDVNSVGKGEFLLSELFGHEKGSFTGASSRKLGVLEIARNGDCFIDEIGDLSIEDQGIFLDVIKNRQIKRLGGSERISTNARLIFATNKNLKKMVQEGTFREDLYSRLTPMTITVPSLMDRKEDIPQICENICKELSTISKNLDISFSDFPTSLKKYLVNSEFFDHIRGLRRQLVILQAIFGGQKKPDYKGWEKYLNNEPILKSSKEISQAEVTKSLDDIIDQLGSRIGKPEWIGLDDTLNKVSKKVFQESFKKHKRGIAVAEVLNISTSKASEGKRKYVKGETS